MAFYGSNFGNCASMFGEEAALTSNKPEGINDSPQAMKPILEPIAKLIDSFDPRYEQQKHRDSGGGGTERVLRALRLLPEPITTTTPEPSPMERIFNPLFDSIRQGLRKMEQPSMAMTTGKPLQSAEVLQQEMLSFNKDSEGEETSTAISSINSESVRRAPQIPSVLASNTATAITMIPPGQMASLKQYYHRFSGPLKSLLEIFGMDAAPKNEIQVGRDETISVLGMPVGRKDGLMLSPLTGLSYGPTYQIGPLAVNDRYNVKWDFLDKIGNALFA